MKSNRRLLIDLKPEEVGILSLVADYAKIPMVHADLRRALSEATPRAQKIGALMIAGHPKPNTCYGFMAKRFLDAREHNAKQMRILRLSTPSGLLFER